jgi:hypothetical protein
LSVLARQNADYVQQNQPLRKREQLVDEIAALGTMPCGELPALIGH